MVQLRLKNFRYSMTLLIWQELQERQFPGLYIPLLKKGLVEFDGSKLRILDYEKFKELFK